MCAKCGPILDTISHQPAITFRVRMDFFYFQRSLMCFLTLFIFKWGPMLWPHLVLFNYSTWSIFWHFLFTKGARCFDHTERMWEERSCSQVFIFSMISICPNWNILLFFVILKRRPRSVNFVNMGFFAKTLTIFRCDSGSTGAVVVTTSLVRSRGCTCR